VHSAQAACAACHRTLDPTRSIFSATWSWNYHHQQDPKWAAEPGMFAFRGVLAPVKSIDEFATVLAHHPLVAPGWVQKLCHHVNSAACDEGDLEFKRLVALFRDSGHDWNKLVKALVTSPITTGAADTRTLQTNGEVVTVARRDQFCAALGARLGLSDPCGLTHALAETTAIPRIASGLPSDAYGRGEVVPILPTEPSLFYVAGLENICKEIADRVIDAPVVPGVRQWSSAQPEVAVADFVATVMALVRSDPRAGKAEQLLRSHFSEAAAETGVSPTQALRSTFVVACLAPSAISVGL
jgi:hypothetical protein